MRIKQIELQGVVFDISDTGYVYRNDYISNKGVLVKGKEIKPYLNTNGYLHFVHGLRVKGQKYIRKMYFIHRLIAQLFVHNPNPEKYKIVDHIDGNKLNNDPSNLRWTDVKGNMNNPITKKKFIESIKKTTQTPEYRKKMSEKMKQVYSDPEVRAHGSHPISEEARLRVRQYDKIWVHNDKERKFIYKEELEHYLNNGYERGSNIKHTDEFKNKISKTFKNRVWVHNDKERKFIYKEELEHYLNNGYERGINKHK